MSDRQWTGDTQLSLLVIVIVVALIATIVALLMGIFVMGAGGEVDRQASTWLMWARVGLQGFAVLLLLLALALN
jgi:hypothetical protein